MSETNEPKVNEPEPYVYRTCRPGTPPDEIARRNAAAGFTRSEFGSAR